MKIKKINSGNYVTTDGRFYVVRHNGSKRSWWSVGECNYDLGYDHIEDVRTLREAKKFITTMVAKETS